jgi:hypothetical protein
MKRLGQVLFLLCLSYVVNAQTNYYISKSITANDNNTGTDTAHSWKTFAKVNKANAIYNLRSGDVFYDRIKSISTTSTTPVVFKPYNSGAKPLIDQFTKVTSGWTGYSTNVYRVDLASPSNLTGYIPASGDMGNVGFLYVDGVIRGAKKAALSNLSSQWDFYSDGVSFLYVYSTTNPSSASTSFELTTASIGITLSDFSTYKNFAVTGVGATVLRGLSKRNVTIDGIDMSYSGGCYLGNAGSTTRFGAGVSLDEGATNVLLQNCTIKHTYEAAMTMQSHGTNPIAFNNVIYTNNITDSTESGFNPSIETGNYGYVGCKVTYNTFKNVGYSWSHAVRPIDNQATAILSNFWNTTQNDLIIENNVIYNPREGVFFLGGKFTDPRFISRNNNITIKADVRLRKNSQNASTPYNYYLADTTSFITDFGYEKLDKWHLLTSGTSVRYYEDFDKDAHGNSVVHKDSVAQPYGYVLNSDDCDDSNATVHPGAVEICGDGVDNNCDGNVDETCNVYYHDIDGDGYGSSDTIKRATPPAGYVSRTGDCNDSDITVNPGAVEICGDGKDNNCNSQIDEGCSLPTTISFSPVTYYVKQNTSDAVLTVVLSKKSTQYVTFNYATIDGTAVSGSEYTGTSQSVTIAPGATTVNFTINIIKSKLRGTSKYFTVRLVSATVVTIDAAEATVNITN